ncbi:hypothetical protein F443_13814 [Phytophthora nicotianae P1569]|uniref:Uncharacterized protein n=1 Tax=Phytophthora nicotianae P1569 TaxID=1317065 RepID=V9ENS8_PHYNI|nr:hypothetical protein F443_13814 [Phytophthora nicotianae P1569]
MEEELERWTLHDCSAFRDARGPDEMKRLFERFRATRGKPVTVTPTVTIRSLDRVWTAFVKRWNLEGREAFETMLKKREADHARLSVGELAGQVCRLSWDQDRRCCIAHFEDGCPHCRELGVTRPDREEWRRIVEAVPVTEVERDVIGRYQRALDEARRAGRARPQRDPSPVRGPSRTPLRSGKSARRTSRGSQLSGMGPNQRTK